MVNVIAVRHVRFEDLGVLEPLLENRGRSIGYIEAPIAAFDELSPEDARIVVLLGGPIGADDEENYPFLRKEFGLIERCLEAGIPLLGICLGAQLIAKVLGGKVYAAETPEFGWSPLRLTEQGQNSWLRHLEGQPVLHWHGDTFELPHGATHLAATEACANQAFCWGKNVLGLQFHAEARGERLEEWLVGHAHELGAMRCPIQQIREDTKQWASGLESSASLFFNEWLEDVLAPTATGEKGF